MITAMNPNTRPELHQPVVPESVRQDPEDRRHHQLGDEEQRGEDADRRRLDTLAADIARNGPGSRSSRAPVRPVLRRRVKVPSMTAVSDRPAESGSMDAESARAAAGSMPGKPTRRAGPLRVRRVDSGDRDRAARSSPPSSPAAAMGRSSPPTTSRRRPGWASCGPAAARSMRRSPRMRCWPSSTTRPAGSAVTRSG